MLLLIITVVGCGSKQVKNVARVGNYMISMQEFEKEFLKAKPIYLAQNATNDEKQKFLNQLIDQKLQLQTAYMEGLDRDQKNKAQLDDIKQRMTYYATLDKKIVFEVIKEDEIRDYYEKSKVEIRARHLLLKLPINATQTQIDSVMAIAKGMITQIRSGADFAEMAQKYSQDDATKNRGGDLGYIRWGRNEQPLLDAVYQLGKYELTPQPVKASRGVEIIQVTDRRNVAQKPYEMERDNIVQILFKRHQSEIMELYNNFNKELDHKHRVIYFENNVEPILSYMANPKVDSLYRTTVGNPVANFAWVDAPIKKLELATYDRGTINIIDLMNMAAKQSQIGEPMPIRNKSQVKKLVEDEVHLRLTADMGTREDVLRDPAYRDQYEDQVKQILVRALREKEINQKIQITDQGLQEFYSKHQENFKAAVSVEVQEILVNDASLATKIAKWARSGQNFDQLVEKYNTRMATKNRKGVLGKITANAYGAIGKTAGEMKIGEISQPIQIGKNYSIIKILNREEEHIKPFEEVKSSVETGFREELIQKRDKEWQQNLRQNYTVRIFRDVLDQALKNIS